MSKFTDQLKNKNFMCLWLAQMISQFGDRINQMALIGLVSARLPGSALGIAKILSFTIIPVFIVGPIAGAYVDRWDRRTTLFVCDILRGLLVLTIPFIFLAHHSLIPIYFVIFIVFCLSRFYIPARMSIIPDLVEEKDLLLANSMVTTTGMIAFVLGVFFGGLIVEHLGPSAGFLWDAMTFFISAFLIILISKDLKYKIDRAKFLTIGKEVMTEIEKSIIQEVKDGISYLFVHREIRFVVHMLFILLAAGGAVYVTMIVFVQQTFGSVTRDLGLLAPFLGTGLFTGALVYGRFGSRFPKAKIMFVCLILAGGMLALFAFLVQRFPSRGTASLLILFLGALVGPIMIAANTVVHEVCAQRMRGKVFSGLEVVIHFAFLMSMLLSAYLSDEHIGSFWILMGVGVIFGLTGLWGLNKRQWEHTG
jgi:MFS family permease